MASTRTSDDLVFDNFDVDILIKVLANTAFSPFFVFFIPVFYFFQGAKLTDPIIVTSGLYYISLNLILFLKWSSRLYRNQGSLFFRPLPIEWSNEVVLITGGASGIGELLANTLAVRNVTVVVLDVNPIVSEYDNIAYYKCDVSDWDDVNKVSKRVIEEIGDPTIIVNNAGIVQGKLLLDLLPLDVKQTFGVNILSHFWIIKAFLPGMLERKAGHIVTISSAMGMIGVAQMSDYCASKAAAMSLHESLRYELDKRYNCPAIRTTLLCPGHVLTPLFQHIQLPTNKIFKFFCPSLQPITVVKQIITALDEQHSQTIYLPFYINSLPYLTHLPSFLRDFVQWAAGADFAMKHFIKVSGRRSDEELFLSDNEVEK